MTRPVWLLDVDGVINALRAGHPDEPTVAPVWNSHDQRHYTIRWSRTVVDRVRAIHDSGTVEIRWCTTWCGDTEALETVLGLPTFEPCWTDNRNGWAGSAAKLAAARQVLADDRRLIWTDDNEVPEPDDPLFGELTAAGRALLIRPDKWFGLLSGDLDAIEAFAATVSAEGGA